MSVVLDAAQRAEILDLLARFAWELDEGDAVSVARLLEPDAVLTRRGRDGVVREWRAPQELPAFIGEHRAVAVEDRQSWTSDATFERHGNAVLVHSTAIHAATLAGGTSNVLLADDEVTTTVVSTPEGWRIAARSACALGAPGDELSVVAVPGSGGEANDRIEIEALLADYAWALDTADMEAVLALFSEDAVMQDPFGRFQGLGPQGIRRFFEGLFARPEFAGRVHWVSQLTLTRIPEGYRADSYALVPTSYASGAVNLHLVAFYRDIIVREGGSWKFRERLVGARWDRVHASEVGEVTPA